MAYLLVKKVKDGFSMLKLSYSSKTRRIFSFLLMQFPLLLFVFILLIVNSFGKHLITIKLDGVLVLIAFFGVFGVLGYWHCFSHYNFLLDRKNRKVVLSKWDVYKEYTIDEITMLRLSFKRAIGRGTTVFLHINNDKFIVKPGNIFKGNLWDTMFNKDKLAQQRTNRIKNILGITDTTN